MERTRVKQKLIEHGYIDNEYLEKYLDLVFANLDTEQKTAATQAHHIIPVNTYLSKFQKYNRQLALELAAADKDNCTINLLYKDHLIAHAYLTLCTNLDIAQAAYTKTTKEKWGEQSYSNISKSKWYKAAYSPELKTSCKNCWINNGEIQQKIPKAELDKYITEGWYKGTLRKSAKGQ